MRDHGVPRRRVGGQAGVAEDVGAARELDHLRQPVPRAEGRVDPLGEEHAPALQPPHRSAAVSIVSHICAARCSPRSTAPSVRASVRTDSATSASVRGSSETTSAADGAGGRRAGHSKRRRRCRDPGSRSDRGRGRRSAPHRPCTATRRLATESRTTWSISRLVRARRVDSGGGHHRLPDDLGGPAALLRDADERVDQPQLRDDLGRARQQRADPHLRRL